MGRFWRKRNQAGFTLIELLIVIAIIAILAAILIPNFLRARRQAVVAATKSNLRNIATVVEEYYVDRVNYPLSLAVLAPVYTPVVPTRPDGGSYGYKTDGGSAPQEFVICDNVTDTITNAPQITTWYWLPPDGLASVVAPTVDVGFAVCP
jgi:prepilin-type N-terminal cleavage/methylation domain-containing protein